jgi:hypothetical protein
MFQGNEFKFLKLTGISRVKKTTFGIGKTRLLKLAAKPNCK